MWQCQRSRKDWLNWLVAEWPLDLAWVHSPRKWARGQNCGIEKWLLEISEESWAGAATVVHGGTYLLRVSLAQAGLELLVRTS